MKKANKRVAEIVSNTSIMVIASHSMEIISKWCNKAMWLEHGQVISSGTTEEVIEKYLNKAA